jgi:hypothetical protein
MFPKDAELPYVAGSYDGAKYYVSGGVAIEKAQSPAVIDKTSIIANGAGIAMVTGIPFGSFLVIDKVGSWGVNDGIFEMTADSPGVYNIRITHPRFLEKEFTVNAG